MTEDRKFASRAEQRRQERFDTLKAARAELKKDVEEIASQAAELLFTDDPCLTGEHCRHKECINHHDMCCWCGEPMETWT